MTGHYTWCHPPLCDPDAEGSSAHRSVPVVMHTNNGPVDVALYTTTLNDAEPSVLVDDFMSVHLSALKLAVAALESLMQPRIGGSDVQP